MTIRDRAGSGRIDDLAAGILAGERRALARGITLVESDRRDHRDEARALVDKLTPHAGGSIRLGISGAPGVGKSTFIEAFGGHIVDRGHKLAVLAIDPSSERTGGSILGDKTRMEVLARNTDAFIRPSPAGNQTGGVAGGTRDAILLAEAAGYDVVIVETVGVGQSETRVAAMVDMFLLLLSPGGGDELQGIKRGIIENADLVIVNKADGPLTAMATQTAAQYRGAINLMAAGGGGRSPEVMLVSAIEGRGIDEVWKRVGAFREAREKSGALARRRSQQAESST